MGIFQKIFRPENALVIPWDHVGEKEERELEQLIEEIGRYYKWARLSDIFPEHSRSRLGTATIHFRNPRKSVILRAVPLLRAHGVSFSLSCIPDCIGSNQLPIQDEIQLYRTQFPDLNIETPVCLTAETTSIIRRELRQRYGSPPLDRADPSWYFCTWGDLKRIPPELWEPVLKPSGNAPCGVDELAPLKRYTEQQLSRRLNFLDDSDGQIDRSAASELFRGRVVNKYGAISASTLRTEIPFYRLEEQHEQKE